MPPDRATLNEWWTRLEPWLLQRARSRTRSGVSEELVQEIAIALLTKKPESFASYEDLQRWAARTLRYRIVDTFLVVRRDLERSSAAALEQIGTSSTQEERLLVREVLAALNQLPERQRDAVLGALHGESTDETAAKLKIAPATVRSLQRFARLRLAQMFSEEKGVSG